MYNDLVLYSDFHRYYGSTLAVEEGREKSMAEIKVGENESLDNALKRFKRQCARAGVLSEYRKREHYEKPSVRRKKKSEAARRKKGRY